jgi:RimJ/RimL family protein N-acetyltransferase
MQIWSLLKNSAESHSPFTPWGRHIHDWTIREAKIFVEDHIEIEPKYESFVFLIGDTIVGMGSIAPFYLSKSKHDVQVVLWVGSPYQNMGIGARIVATLEWYVFEVWGFPRLYYFHELTNNASMKLPEKCKFERQNPFLILNHNYVDEEPVFWCIWVKYRDPSLPPGIFQGVPIEYFTEVRHKIRRNLLGIPIKEF